MTALPASGGGETVEPARRSRVPGLTTQIFIGLVLGVLVGSLWPELGVNVRPLADLFLRMIKMIVAPLIFSTLVVGIAGSGDLRAMGRVGLKAIIYFEIATTLALVIGLVMVNLLEPGAGLTVAADTGELAAMATRQPRGWDLLLHVVPTSVVDAMARGDILQVVVWSTIFGIALAAIGTQGRPVVDVLDAVAQAMFRFTHYVMLFAPIGVFAAIAATVGSRGLIVLVTLGKVVATLYLSLLIFVVLVIVTVAVIIRVPFLTFVRAIREPFMIAFTTASSEAALPKAMEVMERFGVPRRIVGFVLPTGYSFNLDGTTLYLAIASVFAAQIAGIELSIGQQLTIMLVLMLTSKGVAGVPRGALVVLTGSLASLGLPLEGAAILLGIDQLLDMGRTAVNVMGNCIATAVVARWEGVFDDGKMRRFAVADAAEPLPSA